LRTPKPEKAVAAMVVANKTAKADFAAKVFSIIQEIKSPGVQTLRGIASRSGGQWYPATVRNILKIQNT